MFLILINMNIQIYYYYWRHSIFNIKKKDEAVILQLALDRYENTEVLIRVSDY